MKLVGIDLSLTATGWAVYSDNLASFGVIRDVPSGTHARLDYVRGKVLEQCLEADMVAIEGLAYDAYDTERERAGQQWLVRHSLWKRGTKYFLVSPSTLKKYVCGHGGSKERKITKQMVIDDVFHNWGIETTDDNIADAVGLVHIAMALNFPQPIPPTKAQAEVLKTLRAANRWLPRTVTP